MLLFLYHGVINVIEDKSHIVARNTLFVCPDVVFFTDVEAYAEFLKLIANLGNGRINLTGIKYSVKKVINLENLTHSY